MSAGLKTGSKGRKHKMEKKKVRDLGVGVIPPKAACEDRNCAFHGTISLRGRTFSGEVVSTDFNRSATVAWQRHQYINKYERYEVKKSKVRAHNPDCISAKKGDMVTIMESRPISKTKHFVIIEKKEKEE